MKDDRIGNIYILKMTIKKKKKYTRKGFELNWYFCCVRFIGYTFLYLYILIRFIKKSVKNNRYYIDLLSCISVRYLYWLKAG